MRAHRDSRLQKRFRIAGVSMLVLGLVAAAIVYFTAASGPGNGAAGEYRMVDGQAYAVSPDESSREAQQLERIGGKAAVMTWRFQRWFASLWHGERLAAMLAISSIAAAWLCFHLAALAAEED